MTLSVLIQVTHLLGAGHLTRAAALATACVECGHRVTLVSGGMPNALSRHENVDFIQLPPVRIQGTAFTRLLDADGAPVSEKYLAERQAMAVATVSECRPNIVLTELFPFGRRVLASEFLAVMTAARQQARPVSIFASIRDILAPPSRPERAQETLSRLTEYYDAVLVHGDETIVPLDASWPVDDSLRPFLNYTGYIDNPAPPVGRNTREEAPADIIVSGGSSAAGLKIFETALATAKLSSRRWHLLVGNGVTDTNFERLSRDASANVQVERARPDFRNLLEQASLSISQCGYNTAVDLLGLPVRRLFVPFEDGGETEQLLRARTLESRGLAKVLRQPDLAADTLLDMTENMLRTELARQADIRLDGGMESVRIMERLYRENRNG